MSQNRVGRSGLDYAEGIIFERTSPGRVCSSFPTDPQAQQLDEDALTALFGEDIRMPSTWVLILWALAP